MIKLFILIILFLCSTVGAQTNKEVLKMDLLKTEIIKMDSLLFTVAFNECDTTLFKKIIADDIEFMTIDPD